MKEGMPFDRHDNPNKRKELVYTPPVEAVVGILTPVTQLEAQQWSVEHKAYITNVFSRPDGGFRVVLNDGQEVPLDRDDGLYVLDAQPPQESH
jgi:hypothetical protein